MNQIKKIKRNERKQKREITIFEDIGLRRFFELATTNKKCVKSSNLHENKDDFSEDYIGDFELIGKM